MKRGIQIHGIERYEVQYLRDQGYDDGHMFGNSYFSALVRMSKEGIRFEYDGCDTALGVFKLDDQVFQAVEDANDGYRSSLGAIVFAKDSDKERYIDQKLRKLVSVIHNDTDAWEEGDDVELEYFEGYRLIDENGHEWLRFGTETSDNYYPYYVFTSYPCEA